MAPGPGEVEARLAAIVAGELGHVRTSFGQFTRQVSGYSLEHLLPELAKDGRGVSRLLAGSEGTLGLLREVTVSLVPEEERDLLVLGYPSMIEAADAVPFLLDAVAGDARMVACEGLDARIVDLVRARGVLRPGPSPGKRLALHRGIGWAGAAAGLSAALEASAGALDSFCRHLAGRGRRVVADPGGRRRPGGPQPVAAGVLRLGGRCRPARPSWVPGCATSTRGCGSTGSTACPTATSATAACTCGSTSTSPAARGRSASSWWPAPKSCGSAAARCRGSTATAAPGPNCCR